MTGQLTLADCDPAWADLTPRPRRRPATSRPHRDLYGQRLNRRKKYRITDVHIVGPWL